MDLVRATHQNLADAGVESAGDVRAHGTMLCGHSAEMKPLVQELQKFLYRRFYQHPYLQSFRTWAKAVIGGLRGLPGAPRGDVRLVPAVERGGRAGARRL